MDGLRPGSHGLIRRIRPRSSAHDTGAAGTADFGAARPSLLVDDRRPVSPAVPPSPGAPATDVPESAGTTAPDGEKSGPTSPAVPSSDIDSVGTAESAESAAKRGFPALAGKPVLLEDSWAAMLDRRPAPARTGWRRWETRYLWKVAAVDVLSAVLAGLAGLAVLATAHGGVPWSYSWPYSLCAALLPVLWVAVLLFARAYETRYLFVGNEEYRRVILAAGALIAAVAVVVFAADLPVSRRFALAALAVLAAATVLCRFLVRKWLIRQRERGRYLSRVLVVGEESAITDLHTQLGRRRFHGMEIVGACVPTRSASRMGEIPVLGSFDDVMRAVRRCSADTVAVLPCPQLSSSTLRGLLWELEETETELIVAAALLDVAGPRTTIRPIDGLPMLHLDHAELSGSRRAVKRIFDIVVASMIGLVALPLLLVAMAAIRLTSPGPALFRQQRVGKDGRTFRIFKLRSMYVDAERRRADLAADNESDGVLFKIRDDPRITPLGRWLRRFSIDELPQVLNVLAGHMSLVGPRPPLESEVAEYPADMRRRLMVLPGITGLWQVSGRADLSWDDSMRLDLRYVENWSLTLDLVVLLRTVNAVIRSTGAY